MVDAVRGERVKRRHWTNTFTSTSRLILFWYTFVTIAFRCPESSKAVTDTSPWMCKPYFELREQVAPYVTPYYNTYAAPYVDTLVTPYVDTFVTPNVEKVRPYAEKVHSKAYIPVRETVVKTYNKYGATQISQVFDYCDREWEKKVKPVIDQYLGKVQEQYDIYLKPYISKIIEPVYPQAIRARSIAVKQYHESFIPLYMKLLPYGQIAYDRSHQFVSTVIYPYSTWATNKMTVFVTRKIWPTIRILYGQNVEPQLSKISERLGSYWDAKSLEAAVVAIDNPGESSNVLPTTSFSSMTTSSSSDLGTSTSTFAEPDTSTTSTPSESQSTQAMETQGILESILSKVTATAEPTATPIASEVVSSTTEETTPTASTTAEKVTEDLERWQTKFKLAADKGADDLSERVSQITKRQIEGQVRSVGEALVIQLEDASKEAFDHLKAAINKAVRDLPEDASDDDKEASVDGIRQSIRSAGKNLKEKAQDLRSWKARFDANTDALVEAASRSTLNVIDGIRDLGLQEIGLRWASMDSVTYQDWAEYHNLKETFDGWRGQVLKVATDHAGLLETRREADDIEGRGMAIAENAAKELARLKDVASWKIHAHDSSDDFGSTGLQAAAASFGHQIMEKITGSATTASASSSVTPGLSSISDAAPKLQSTVAQAGEDNMQPIVEKGAEGVASVDEYIQKGSEGMSSVLDATRTLPSVAEITSSFFEAMASITGPRASRDLESSASDLSGSASSSATQFVEEPLSSASSFISDTSEAVIHHTSSLTTVSSIMDTASDSASSVSSAVASPASSISSGLKDEIYAKVAAIKEQIPIFSTSSISSQISAGIPGTEEVMEGVSTVTSSISSTASSAMSDVSATVAPSLSSGKHDVMDNVYEASRSLQSRFSEAGENYAKVTGDLAGV